eukprot:561437-Prymnesium_polylepis.1
MGNDFVTVGRIRRSAPVRVPSVRPVRTPVRVRPPVRGPSEPFRTSLTCTCHLYLYLYLLQTQSHPIDQVYWVCPTTQVSHALVAMAAYVTMWAAGLVLYKA